MSVVDLDCADDGCSSAILWVAQNMEDEYTYNLAL